MRTLRARALVASAALAMVGGCAHLGVVEDGTSVSWGRANRGGILNPARLPDSGDGYRVPVRWSTRGLRYGTDELVDFVVQTSRRFAFAWPGGRVTVADLSWPRGGGSQWHRSHQSGRDVDLVFFVTDDAGRPVDPEDMRHFGPDGGTCDDAEAKAPHLRFDVARNWALVRAIMAQPASASKVQHIFIFEPLAQMLLEHARAIGEPEAVIAQARALMKQPGDSAPHDDHMHVRLLCSADDVAYGCQDYGAMGAVATIDGDARLAWHGWPLPLQQLVLAQEPAVPAMLALVGLPILR